VRGPVAGDATAKSAKIAKQALASSASHTEAAKRVEAAKTAAGSSGAHEEPSRHAKPPARTGSGETETAAAASKGRKRRRQPAETDLSPEEMARRAHQRKRRVPISSTPLQSCPGISHVHGRN